MAGRNIQQSIQRRREQPTVLVTLSGSSNDWMKLFQYAQEHDWDVLDPRYRRDGREDSIFPSGAIVTSLPTEPSVKKLLKHGCKVVRIGNAPHPKDHIVPAATHDLNACGRLAADHFHERGFKHVGYVGFKPWSAKRELYEGLNERARELGIKCHLLQWRSGSFRDQGERYEVRQKLLADWLETVPKPLGLLGFVDGHAAMLCNMCEDAGVSVPEEVAVLGYGNLLAACEGSRPRLSSIELDDDARIEAAARMLDRLMKGKQLEKTIVPIPPKGIVVRESTDILAVPDGEVARALRFMWSNLDLDMGIDDIAREVGMSRRHLTRRFRVALGRTVTEELRRKRLEEVKRLLRETDYTVTDITGMVGLRSQQYLHRAFQRAFGTTPLKYRQGMPRAEITE